MQISFYQFIHLISSGRLFYTLLVFSLFISLSCNGQVKQITYDDVKEIADLNASELWGNVDSDDPIPYYGPNDEIIAYHFTYAIDQEFPNAQTLKEQCFQAFESGERKSGWGDDEFGNIVIGANTDMPVFIEHSKCLPKQYALGKKLQMAAINEFGPGYLLDRTYYLGLVHVWFCYSNGSNKKYINIEPYVQIKSEEEFIKFMSEKTYFWERDEFAEDWVKFMDNKDPIDGGTIYIPGEELMPYLEWSYGCSPTAAAMLLAWWDNYHNFGNLIDYHVERWDNIQENTDYHVPRTQNDLRLAMGTNSSGGTYRGDMSDGYIEVVEDRGYNCSSDGHWAFWWTVGELFDDVKTQINNNRPLQLGIDNHSLTAVGYNNACKTVKTHDSNQSTERSINRSMLEATFWVFISDNYGTSVDLEAPNGGSVWNGNGGDDKETLESNDFFEISWSCPAPTNTYVKLYYHDEGGWDLDRWFLIDGNTENDGEYIWHVPAINSYYGTSTEHARIKIEVYDMANNLIASDGSYGNFNINAGGQLTQLTTTAIEQVETNPDFFSIHLNNQTWSVVGVRDEFGYSDWWYLDLYDNVGFSNFVDQSHNWHYVNYIALNGNSYPTGWYGIKPWNNSGKETGFVQYDNDASTLGANTTHNLSWTYNDLVQIHSTYLTPGTYYFYLDVDTLSSLDLNMALYKWGGDNLFPMEDNVGSSFNFGFGVDESFHYTVWEEGTYGLCISSSNGASGDFDVTIHGAGRWTGALDEHWNFPQNWANNAIPNENDDVIIPAGCVNMPLVYSGAAFCRNLTVEDGAQITINDHDLVVYGDLKVFGHINMLGPNSRLIVENSIQFEDGSWIDIQDDDPEIICYRSWYNRPGSYPQLERGTVRFVTDHPSFIVNNSSNAYFHDVIIDKTNGNFQFHLLSTEKLKIEGDLQVKSGSTLLSNSEEEIWLYDGLTGTGDIKLNAGTCVFIGEPKSLDLSFDSYFNNLRFYTSSASIMFNPLTVKGNLLIEAGGLIPIGNTIYVGGDWQNIPGTDYFLEGTGRVVFMGDDEQYCYGEEFNVLEMEGDELIFSSGITTCEQYDWTYGNIVVDGGTFTANDLTDNGLFGTFEIKDGECNLYQGTDQYVDLNCEVYMSGGTFNIYGGMDDSYWSYANTCEVHMNGGVLDFKDVGIRIHDGSYNFWYEAQEGTVRTAGNLFNDRYDFNPTHGNFEMYGPAETQLYCVTNGSFFNINIDKNATKGVGKSYIITNPRIPLDPLLNPKTNDVALTNNLSISGDLSITSGSLDLNGHVLIVGNDLVINDLLIMNDPGDIAHIYGSVFWKTSSVADITEGLMMVGKDFTVESGALVQYGTNSTLRFNGSEVSNIYNNEDGTSFGDLDVYKTDNYTIFAPSPNLFTVNGILLVKEDNILKFDNSNIICNVTIWGEPNSTINHENNATLEVFYNCNLQGDYILNSGQVICHDNFQVHEAGQLRINDGSFILDRPYSTSYYNLLGGVVINDGTFEITHDGLNLGPDANINQDGGTIRIGWGLKALNPNNFEASNGIVEFIGSVSGIIQFENSNFIYDLKANKTGSGVVNNIDNLNIQNDLWVANNQFNIGANDVTIGGDVIIESTGILKADNGDLFVEGDWMNNAGDAGFLEGYKSVYFEGSDNSHILTDETFSTVFVNKSGGMYTYVFADPNTTINFTGDLSIDGCSFRLEENATINVHGDVIINENTAMFASPSAETNINLKGFWNNYNTTGYPFENGFYYGLSTVNFYDDSNGGVETSGGVQEFYNLQLTKGIEHFYPYNDITVHNDVFILSGIWGDYFSGLTYTFLGDITIWEQGLIDDNLNTFVFAGAEQQDLYNGSLTTINLGNLNVQKNISAPGASPLLLLYGDLHCNGSAIIDSGDFHINNYTIECEDELIINANGRVIAPGQSIISMGSSGLLEVNGGALELVGDALNNPIVNSTSGNYEFSVANQGLLTAVHAIFENMDINGVRIYNTGLVYGTNAFSNCTFQDGATGGTLLRIDNVQDLIINGANFPSNTWSGTYNVTKALDQGTITFTNFTGDFAGDSFENDTYNRIGWDEMIPGIWEGTISHSWNNANNWEHSLKPTATDDVYIPAGTDYDPWVASTDQFCNNVTIEAGASLRIFDEILTVYGSMIIYGNLKMDNAAGVLNVGDHFGEMISWESGSTDEITSGTINVYGNWYFKNGTSAILGPGNTVNIFGTNRSYIYCDDDDAAFGNLEINKSLPPKDYVQLNSGDTLRVSEDLYVFDGDLNILSGSYVYVGNELYIENGCTLSIIGTATAKSVISGYPNYCAMDINNGATISAEYAIFEYLESSGVAISPTATIDPLHPFNYCTFRESPAGGKLLTIANNQTLTIDGAIFPPNSWGGAYNVNKQNDNGQITFTNVEGVFVGENYEQDPFNRVDWPGVIPGIWTGEGNSLWNVLVNWKYQLKPTASDDAIIPAGCLHNPRVTLLPQECRGIEIEAGASLEIYNQTLTVHDYLNISGELIMNHSGSKLNAGNSNGDHISWDLGSTSDITAGLINVYGDWYFQNGTNAQLSTGNLVTFWGSDNSVIYCYDSNAEFGNIKVNKTGSSNNVVFVPENINIRIMEDLYIQEGEFRMDEGTTLAVQNELYVSDGGILTVKGTPANPVLVTGYPSYPSFDIASGGTISAAYTKFEFFNSNGVVVENGAIIDPTYPFYNCTFRESPAGGTLLSIDNDQVVTIDGASFPANSWSGDYNVRKISDQGQVTFTNFSGDFSGENNENDLNNRIDWHHPWYNMNLKVFLEGPYGTGQMKTDLDNIPHSQPYNVSPWNYDGLENTPVIPSEVVDWVIVELRDAVNAASATSATIIDRKAAFLRKDGYIKDLGGLIDVQFNKHVNHNLFVVIWHRNHLGVMSGFPLQISGDTYSFDFSASDDHAYNYGHKEIDISIWGMAGGNGYPDKYINQGDYITVWQGEAGESGYLMGDYNLDKQVNNVDKNDILLPNGGFECQVPE